MLVSASEFEAPQSVLLADSENDQTVQGYCCLFEVFANSGCLTRDSLCNFKRGCYLFVDLPKVDRLTVRMRDVRDSQLFHVLTWRHGRRRFSFGFILIGVIYFLECHKVIFEL